MKEQPQHVAPVLIGGLRFPTPATRLKQLMRSGSGETRYDEELIQRLVDLDPHILPIEEIDPTFAGLRSVCTELPLGRGDDQKYADNLLVSPGGRICLVECKLWQNRESTREVLGQLLDYASRLAGLGYEELVAVVRTALKRGNGDPIVEKVLGSDATEDERLDFAERVARSLQRADFLLLIVGDRIRTDLKRITDLLQNHATLGFAVGLIEMAIYGDDEGKGPYYVQPRVLLWTEIVTRTVFLTGEGPARSSIAKVEPPSKPATLSEQEFFAGLREANASYPEQVQRLFERCRELGCEPRLLRRFGLYMDDPVGGRISLGAITKVGKVEFYGVAGRDQAIGEAVGRAYMGRIASFLPGAQVKDGFASAGSWYIRYQESDAIVLKELLAHEDAWLAAIGDVAARFRELERARDEP
jgi:hypothetical protein